MSILTVPVHWVEKPSETISQVKMLEERRQGGRGVGGGAAGCQGLLHSISAWMGPPIISKERVGGRWKKSTTAIHLKMTWPAGILTPPPPQKKKKTKKNRATGGFYVGCPPSLRLWARLWI